MANQEENSAIVFANRKQTAVTDPDHILQNVARIPHTFPSKELLNGSLRKTPPHATTANVNLSRGGLTDLPKVNDVIYCKAGMSPGQGKPVSVTPFEKLAFPPPGHFSCFGGLWKNVTKNFRRTSVY